MTAEELEAFRQKSHAASKVFSHISWESLHSRAILLCLVYSLPWYTVFPSATALLAMPNVTIFLTSLSCRLCKSI